MREKELLRRQEKLLPWKPYIKIKNSLKELLFKTSLGRFTQEMGMTTVAVPCKRKDGFTFHQLLLPSAIHTGNCNRIYLSEPPPPSAGQQRQHPEPQGKETASLFTLEPVMHQTMLQAAEESQTQQEIAFLEIKKKNQNPTTFPQTASFHRWLKP